MLEMHEQVFFSRSMVSVQGLRLQGSKHAMFSGWNTKIVSFLLEKKKIQVELLPHVPKSKHLNKIPKFHSQDNGTGR